MRGIRYGWVDAGLRLVAFAMIVAAGLMQAGGANGADMSGADGRVPSLARIGSELKAAIVVPIR